MAAGSRGCEWRLKGGGSVLGTPRATARHRPAGEGGGVRVARGPGPGPGTRAMHRTRGVRIGPCQAEGWLRRRIVRHATRLPTTRQRQHAAGTHASLIVSLLASVSQVVIGARRGVSRCWPRSRSLSLVSARVSRTLGSLVCRQGVLCLRAARYLRHRSCPPAAGRMRHAALARKQACRLKHAAGFSCLRPRSRQVPIHDTRYTNPRSEATSRQELD